MNSCYQTNLTETNNSPIINTNARRTRFKAPLIIS